MAFVMDAVSNFLEYEANFKGQDWIDFQKDHGDIPVLVVGLYLAMIFYAPGFIKTPIKCRGIFAVWNLLLTVFSVLGASRCVPVLLASLREKGFHYTVCQDPEDWYLNGGVGLWTGLFVYSKMPELLDTVFLVVQKKKVIFLHWFHHVTVLLYCWHAFHHRIAPGLWFATMNFCVHSIMYGYYFLSIIGFRKVARPVAPLITAVQVLQMVGGIVVTVVSAYTHYTNGPDSCHVNGSNYRLGLTMYSTYFVLFVILFYDLYIRNAKARSKDAVSCPPPMPGGVGCPAVPDAGEAEKAGLFFFEKATGEDGKPLVKRSKSKKSKKSD